MKGRWWREKDGQGTGNGGEKGNLVEEEDTCIAGKIM